MTAGTFSSVREKLQSIQKGKKEPELFPVLKQLFTAKKYNCVEIIHGINEFGKDLVFKEYDVKLKTDRWYSVVVKNKNASQEDFEEGGEILRQIKLSFEHPYSDASGEEHYPGVVIVVINGSVSPQAKSVLSKMLQPHQKTNVEIWNYQRLEEEIESEIKDLFLSGDGCSSEDLLIAKYKQNQINILSDLDNAKDFFTGLNISQINDIFVNIRTLEGKYEAEKNLYRDQIEKSNTTGEVDDSIFIINSNKHTIIQGIPTSGKTLLLKRIGINALKLHGNIGVFWFKFRKIDITNLDIDLCIKQQFEALTDGGIFKDNFFEKHILLFDGLDEIKTDSNRENVVSKINNYISTHDKTQVIISGRSIDIFETDLFNIYDKITLLPFDVGQALKLVKKLIPGNKAKSTQFVEAIKNCELSNSLTRTPMALTLMAILYRDDAIDLSELPANITELYNKFCDYYLNRWDATKGLAAQYKFEETKHILAFIAHYLHIKGKTEIDTSELKTFLNQLYKSHSLDELSNVDAFIDGLKNRSGVFVYNDKERTFSFNNLTFQEYFTSVYFDDSSEALLITNLYQDWWANVIIFYSGKNPKRDVLICKALESTPANMPNKFKHMQILSKCLQASHLISNDSEQKTIENIIYTFDSFYKEMLLTDLDNTSKSGVTYSFTTLDIILQFRRLFEQLFATKHIDSRIFSDVALRVLTNNNYGFSDITLYCISHFLAHRLNDATYFNYFLEIKDLNTRWDRIILRDVENFKQKRQLPDKILRRITRKQERNKKYINQQFKEAAVLHLSDGVRITISDEDM